jgi:hypothetical protein
MNLKFDLKSWKPKHFILTGLAIIAGLFGINKAISFGNSFLTQRRSLEQSPNLLASIQQFENGNDIGQLKANQPKINSNIQILESIPNFPGFSYEEARKRITELRSANQRVTERINLETQTSGELTKAKKLDTEALELAGNPPHPEEQLQQASDKWQEAIRILEKISSESPLHLQAQQGLPFLKKKLEEVSQILIKEKQSLRNMEEALGAASLAKELIKDKYSIESSDLINAQAQWYRSVSLLKQISNQTTVFDDAAVLLPAAERNWQRNKFAFEKFTACRKEKEKEKEKENDSIISSTCSVTAPIEVEDLPIDSLYASAEPSDDTETSEAVDLPYISSTVPYLERYRSRRVAGFSASSSVSGSTHVSGYTRSDGTYVRGHTRGGGGRVSGFGSGRSSGGG